MFKIVCDRSLAADPARFRTSNGRPSPPRGPTIDGASGPAAVRSVRGVARRAAVDFTTVRVRMEELRCEHEGAKDGEGEDQRNAPPIAGSGAIRWLPSETSAGLDGAAGLAPYP